MAESVDTTIENIEVVVKGDPIPSGKYTIVACDIDTTGKRLIDEVRKKSCVISRWRITEFRNFFNFS